MIENTLQSPGVFIPATQLVESGRPYWVQCPEFTCWAVVYKDGRWKDSTTGKNLPDVLNVFASPQPQRGHFKDSFADKFAR